MEKEFIISKRTLYILLGILIFLGLYLTSLYNYLLFHSLAEIFSIVVACGIFMVAWNSSRFLDNNYLLFIGIAFLFIAALDLVHTLAYTGMNIFQGYKTNLPTQLWIAARYVESFSLLIAPFFLGRKLKMNFVFFGYTLAITLLLLSIFYWDIFPTCFVEGVGLTPFKIISEYVISLILVAAIALLLKNRSEFDRNVLQWVVWSIILTIFSELAFTFYIHAYGFSNLVGHYLKIISFYLIYKAIIETGLTRPYTLLDRNLKQREEALQRERDKARKYLDIAGVILVVIDSDQRVSLINKKGCVVLGYKEEEIIGKNWFDHFFREAERNKVKTVFSKLITGDIQEAEYSENLILTKSGEERLIAWHNTLLRDEIGNVIATLSSGEDITERKRVEETLLLHSEIMRNMDEGVNLVRERDSIIVYTNPKFEKIFGYGPGELIGKHISIVNATTEKTPEEIAGEITESLRKKGIWRGQVKNIRKDGTSFWCLANVSTFDHPEYGRVFVSVQTDITEHKRADEALKWESELNLAKAELLNAILATESLEDISSRVLEHARHLARSEYGFAGYIDPETGYAITPTLTKDIWDICEVQDKDIVFKKFTGLWGWVLENQKPLLTNSPSQDPRSSGIPHGHVPIHRFLSAPALFEGKLVGQLALANSDRDYSRRDLELVEGLAAIFAIAIYHKRVDEALQKAKNELEKRVQERTAELSKTNELLAAEIAERKRAEEAVKSERQRFNDVLEILPAYLVLLTPDYHVPFANRFFRERFGESHGRRCFEYLFGRSEPCEICDTYTVLKTMSPHEWEWTGPDGRIYDVFDFPFTDTDGSTLILEMGIDITERKRAEEALRAASLYTRSLIEASLDPLVTISVDGKVMDVNSATELVTGVSREQLIGTDFSDYFIEPEKAKEGYKEVFLKGVVRDYPLAIRHTSGKVTDVLYHATVFRNETGVVQGVFAAARDITMRKGLQRRIEATNALLSLFVKMPSRKDYLDAALELIQNWSGCRCAGIRVLEGQGNIPYESYVGFSREFWESENFLSVEKNQCVCIRVITGKMDPQDAPLVTPGGSFCCGNTVKFIHQLSEEEKNRYRSVCVENGFLSVAIIPVRYGEKILGAIHLADEMEDKVTFKVLEFIESIAPLIGEAIHRFNLEEVLRESENRLRMLSSQLLTVQEAERKRIAREIHDGIGQVLAAIKFGLESKLGQMRKGASPPGVSIESIISLAQNGIEESRRIQMDLRPSVLDDLGILATLSWFTREFQNVYSRISIEKEIDIQEEQVPYPLKIVLFRVMQEALNNIAKHSKADLIRISLRKVEDNLELMIEDNGVGFELESIRKGLGLTSMRERAELSGGSFAIESTIGTGTKIKAIWPI